MGFQLIKPSNVLSPFIKYYWVLENCLGLGERHIQRVVPSGFAEMTFYFEKPPEYIREKQTIRSANVLNGQQNSYFDIALEGKTDLLSVVFKPFATKAFFNLPLSEICNQNIPLEYIWQSDYKELNNRMLDAETIDKKVEILESFLVKKLEQSKEFEIDRMCHSINIITQKRGDVSISDLASEVCLSEKQFVRTFNKFIGIVPKKYLRIIRFQNSLHIMQTRNLKNLTELAYEAGYFDQSHMINEFKSLSGVTPKIFFSECEAFSDFFS